MNQVASELSMKFGHIHDNMGNVNDAMTSTGAATEEVSASVNEVNESIQFLSEETAKTSEEVKEILKRKDTLTQAIYEFYFENQEERINENDKENCCNSIGSGFNNSCTSSGSYGSDSGRYKDSTKQEESYEIS